MAGHLDFALSEPQQGVQGSWPDALVPGLVDRVRNRPIWTNRIIEERLDGLSSGKTPGKLLPLGNWTKVRLAEAPPLVRA